MTVALILIAVALVVYAVRVRHHRETGEGLAEAARSVVREEHQDRYGFTRAEQNAEADRLRAADPSLSNYKALRLARRNLEESRSRV